MEHIKSSFRQNRLAGFRYAFQGVRLFLRSEPNARIHALATGLVIIGVFGLHVTITEAAILFLAIGLVWAAELFNTAMEKMMDIYSTEHHPGIGFVKDVAAGAVAVCALTAAITGGIIFIPKLVTG